MERKLQRHKGQQDAYLCAFFFRYSKVWFNTSLRPASDRKFVIRKLLSQHYLSLRRLAQTPRLVSAERTQRFGAFGIKPDGFINFLSNEATVKHATSKDTSRLASGSLIVPFN
jgi:hypothetical protein